MALFYVLYATSFVAQPFEFLDLQICVGIWTISQGCSTAEIIVFLPVICINRLCGEVCGVV